MSELLEATVESTDDDFYSDLVHTVCDCNPDYAFCGVYLGDGEEGPVQENEVECAVCRELDKVACERCGV